MKIRMIRFENIHERPSVQPPSECWDKGKIKDFIQSTKSDGTFRQLLEEASDHTMTLFMEVNQYLNFNREDELELQNTTHPAFRL